MKHRYPPAERVSHQPVVKYVVTIQRCDKLFVDVRKIQSAKGRRAAVTRQIDKQMVMLNAGRGDRLPFAMVAEKAVQPDDSTPRGDAGWLKMRGQRHQAHTALSKR